MSMLWTSLHLHSGTIRANLDPFDSYSDDQLMSALRAVELVDFVDERGGLAGLLTENGGNASVACVTHFLTLCCRPVATVM